MAQTAQSALELKCQFISGYEDRDKEGRWKAPPTGTYDEGTFVKKTSDGLSWEQCGDNDATHILEQPVGTGPVANAANREFYLQGFPQNMVANGAEITAYPSSGGRTIRTSVVAEGSATGAINTSTAVDTQVEAINGLLRVAQVGSTPIGETKTIMNSNGYIEIYLY